MRFLWPLMTAGQLGQGNITNLSSPTQIGALATWSVVSASQSSSYAITTSGRLWAWGQNIQGQLGLGNNTYYYSSPKQVGSLTTWTAVEGTFLSALGLG